MGRKTPGDVRAAIWMNLGLLLVALILPQAIVNSTGVNDATPLASGATAAAMSFAVPMVLMLVIGAGAIVRAYVLSRAQGTTIRWTAFLPVSLFFVGLVGVLGMVLWQGA
ncbi:MAG: hypothetical protein ABI811_03035 [Acidobacteriota bacterium]